MRKENQFITFAANQIGRLYLFGSWLKSQTPNDLDLLFVYRSHICSPQAAITVRRAVEESGSVQGFGRVHIVLLSEEEEAQSEFIKSVGAIPLEEWINAKSDSWLRSLIKNAQQRLNQSQKSGGSGRRLMAK
jgi:hypothetical protein